MAIDISYPVGISIPHNGRVYLFFRANRDCTGFMYSVDNGQHWSSGYKFIHDTHGDANRVYAYGMAYDPTLLRMNVAFTYNHFNVVDLERGVWYIYSTYDDTDAHSLNVGFNIFRWSDGSIAGYTAAI